MTEAYSIQPDDISFKTYLPAVPEAVEVAFVLLRLQGDPIYGLDKLHPLAREDYLEGIVRVIEVLPNIPSRELGARHDQDERFAEFLETVHNPLRVAEGWVRDDDLASVVFVEVDVLMYDLPAAELSQVFA